MYIYDQIYIPIDNIKNKEAFKNMLTYEIQDYKYVKKYKNYRIYADGKTVIIPSGAFYKVQEFLKSTDMEDRRHNFPIDITFKGQLWKDQQQCTNEFLQYKSGFLNSKAGSGKTVMACYILSQLKQRFLVIVPTVLLLYQWRDRINEYLPNTSVALLGDKNNDYTNQDALIAVIDSLHSHIVGSKFGAVIIDEVHRLPANTYRETINRIPRLYTIGLSANTTRRDQKHVMIEDYIGPHIVYNKNPNIYQAQIKMIDTGLDYCFHSGDSWATLLTDIAMNEQYNKLIAENIKKQIEEDRRIAVLSSRLIQLNLLKELLPEAYIINSTTKQEARTSIFKQVNEGKIRILLCSKQIFEEGADIQALDTLHLVSPSNNYEKLEQALGRIERVYPKKKQPIVYDYCFLSKNNNALMRQQRLRYNWYKKNDYQIEILRS